MRKQITLIGGISLLVSATLVCSLLTGCQWRQEKAEEMSSPPSAVTEPEPAQTSSPSPAQREGADKEETVYVQAGTDGTTKKVTVEVRLRNPGDGKPIPDRSNLTNVRSTKGDEEYTQEGDALLWENHGADISYKGESTQPLPVRVRLSATLNGKKLPPEQLAGRSGHLVLRFDYENLTEELVTVQAKQKEKKDKKDEKTKPKTKELTVKVPFVAMTALFLSDEVFSNVKVTNGECMKTDEQTMVLGYACPGMAESLRLADFEAAEKIEVPEYVEVEADVTDFELDFTATVLTPELVDKLESDSLDDLDELAQGMEELLEASDKLTDATGKLHRGLKKFQRYLHKYTKAIHTVRQGSEKMRKGLSTLNNQTIKLQEQLEEIGNKFPPDQAQKNGEKTPAQLLEEAQTALDAVNIFVQSVDDYLRAVEGEKGSALSALESIDWSGMESDAAAAARKQVEQECERASEKLNLTDDERETLIHRLTQCIDLSGVTAAAQKAMGEAQSDLKEIPDASALVQGAKSLSGAVEELQGILVQMEPYVGALPQLKELSAAAAAYAEGVERLSDGAETMTDALRQLDKAGSKLNKGFSGGVNGAKKLAKAMKKFDQEGIEELNGQDMEEFAFRLRAVRQAGKDYRSFSGLAPGRTGSVRFVIETEEIREKK